jgi:hypothetical protein
MAGAAGEESDPTMDGNGMAFADALSMTLNSTTDLRSSALNETMQLTKSLTVGPMNGPGMLIQSNAKRLGFINGKGVRFVTAFGSPKSAIKNESLYYIYHGLTNDGMYHVSAVLPLSSTLLPADGAGAVTSSELEFPSNPNDADVQRYLDNVVQTLDTPGKNGPVFDTRLQDYDKLIGSIQVNTDLMP